MEWESIRNRWCIIIIACSSVSCAVHKNIYICQRRIKLSSSPWSEQCLNPCCSFMDPSSIFPCWISSFNGISLYWALSLPPNRPYIALTLCKYRSSAMPMQRIIYQPIRQHPEMKFPTGWYRFRCTANSSYRLSNI